MSKEEQKTSSNPLRLKLSSEDDYPVNAKELHLFHVELEKREFDQKTGKKLSKPFVQKFTKSEWAIAEKRLQSQGYTTIVLFDPNEL